MMVELWQIFIIWTWLNSMFILWEVIDDGW